MMCKKCTKITGVFFLVLGVLFLLQNLGMWDFWGVQWYTALFLLVGVIHFAKSSCGDCQACCGPAPTGKKKK